LVDSGCEATSVEVSYSLLTFSAGTESSWAVKSSKKSASAPSPPELAPSFDY
jgi:hypothetical protein